MCFEFDEYAEVFKSTFHVAAKEHKCSDCQGIIPKGERYRSVFIVFDGEPDRYKECRRCTFDRIRIIKEELAEGCHRDSAEPAMSEVYEGLLQHDWKRTSQQEVPAEFDPVEYETV